MAERPRRKSKKRSHLAKKFIDLGMIDESLPAGWDVKHILIGLVICLLVTSLLIEYRFQSIPDYLEGEIADRTVEAPVDFMVVDEEATDARRAEAVESVPAVFSFDFRINQRLVSEISMAFTDARGVIAEFRERLGLEEGETFRQEDRRELKSQLEEMLPRFSHGETIEICLKYGFSKELEDQLIGLILQAMRFPGVVVSRDVLLRYRDRGISVRNPANGQMEVLKDLLALRDLEQAADLLKQQEYELTLVSGEEKRELIGFLERWLVPNTDFDETATQEDERRAIAEVDPVLNQVKKGKTIVRAGDEITESDVAQLNELKNLQMQDRWVDRVAGVFLIALFFFGVLWLYFRARLLRNEDENKDYLILASVMIISLIIFRAALFLSDLISGSLRIPALQDPLNFYFLAPVALGAILAVLLLEANLALFYSLVQAVFVGIATEQLTMLVYSLAGSLIAIYALRQYRERSALIRAGVMVAGVNLLFVVAMQLLSSEFHVGAFLVRCGAAIVSGLTASMLTSFLLPTFESVFDRTTDIRLLELSNLNTPILRRLALEAPGTYHHSITVGTLAESGAEAIGANTLLIRVGAYYHDIGKLKHPEYYVENQIFMVNKHEGLSPTMSSLILASHVKDGLAIAGEMKLGKKVADLIPQHHGTRVMTFFYQKAKEAAEAKDLEVSKEDFRYPGPKPQGKEAAILMLADQVEAAARTLQDPSPGQIRSLIARITQATIQDGQLDECEINMKELTKVAHAFERVLTGMYHHRIEYPGFDFNKQQVETKQSDSQRVQ